MPKIVLAPNQVERIVTRLLGTPPRYRGARDWRWRDNHSLSVTPQGLWFDFEAGEGGALVDLIARERRCSRHDAYVWLGLPPLHGKGVEPFVPPPDLPEPETSPPQDPDEIMRHRLAVARTIHGESTSPIDGTPAERYLMEQRGLDPQRMPNGTWPPTLRWNAARKVLVAPVHDIITNELVAIQAINLNLNGTPVRDDTTGRKRKRTYGRVTGNAVRFGWDKPSILGLAEGVETALAASLMWQIPVWASLGTSNLKRLTIPHGVRTLVLIADADSAGRTAAIEAAAELTRPGLAIFIVEPSGDGKDANDVLLDRKAAGDPLVTPWHDHELTDDFRQIDLQEAMEALMQRKSIRKPHWQERHAGLPTFRTMASSANESVGKGPRRGVRR